MFVTLSYDGASGLESLVEAETITIRILLEDGTQETSLQVSYLVDVIAAPVIDPDAPVIAPSFARQPNVNEPIILTVGIY